ncbi:hypothetical protein CHS0354_021435 [Potamilus streckersoni]|uniref:F-box domain-containing protein n=1 Tax=Potamilus streckersoni TaxID=2493646 RepID=A0AAE0S1L3_9BIVA|nr:hypothetical protein CHS0354_021435 [Potamilus streckersoni]
MWDSIAPVVLLNIFKYLSLKEKLSASLTCRNWRNVLENPRCFLLESIHLDCICSQRNKNIHLIKKFLRQSEKITFEWSRCCENDILEILQSLAIQFNHIREITLKPRGRVLCKRRCNYFDPENTGISVKDSDKVADVLKLIVSKSSHLRLVSCGFDQCFGDAVISAVHEKLFSRSTQVKSTSLYGLSIASWACEVGTGNIEMLTNILLFSNLHWLCTNWDQNLSHILDVICDNPGHLQVLSLVVHNMSPDCIVTINPNIWDSLGKLVPNLQLHLILVEADETMSFPDIFCPTMTLKSLTIVFQSIHFIDNVVEYFSWYSHCLESLGVHCMGEILNEPNISPQNFGSFLRNSLKNLRRLAISGVHITDNDVLTIATEFSSQLQELNIFRSDIVKECMATDYVVKLTLAQLYGLEKTVSLQLRRPWTAISNPTIQRRIRQNTFKYLAKMGLSVLEIIPCVLQDCGIGEIN